MQTSCPLGIFLLSRALNNPEQALWRVRLKARAETPCQPMLRRRIFRVQSANHYTMEPAREGYSTYFLLKAVSSLLPGRTLPSEVPTIIYLALGVTWWNLEVTCLGTPTLPDADWTIYHKWHSVWTSIRMLLNVLHEWSDSLLLG